MPNLLADQALDTLIEQYDFTTVLDVGCGDGAHAQRLRRAEKLVTCIDYRPRCEHAIAANYVDFEFATPFDAIWVSHVLEHQPNVQQFLRKLYSDLKPSGVLAITVPPLKHEIVGGHLTLWNLGLLLYNLVVAGFDCSHARCKQYDYNLSVLTPKIPAELPREAMRYANGDIELLAPFFPQTPWLSWRQAFSGDIAELNWHGERVRLRREKKRWWKRLRRRRAA